MDGNVLQDALIRWIPGLPILAGCIQGLLIGVLRVELSRPVTAMISGGALVGALAIAVASFFQLIGLAPVTAVVDPVTPWIGAGVGQSAFSADLSLRLDALAGVLVGALLTLAIAVHAFSVGAFPADGRIERGHQRHACYLDLGIGAALLLLLADNLVLLLAGWATLGLAGSLVAGFWYEEDAASRAVAKVFVLDRFGDAALLAGVLLLFWGLSEVGVPTLDYSGISVGLPLLESLGLPFNLGAPVALPAPLEAIGNAAQAGARALSVAPGGAVADAAEMTVLPGVHLLPVVVWCLLIAAATKAAQIPLHVWLPDAMGAPLPAAGLLHCAAMGLAGVYLLCRFSFLFAEAPLVSEVLLWVGALTVLYAGAAALIEGELGRVLAYLAMGQFGFAFAAAGAGAPATALFQALAAVFVMTGLFLCAAMVALCARGETRLDQLGGLRQRLPVTHVFAVFGIAAIPGIVPTATFFAHEEVLASVLAGEAERARLLLFAIMAAGSALAGLAGFRLLIRTFHGQKLRPQRTLQHLEEENPFVQTPLYVLGMLTLAFGLLTPSDFWGRQLDIQALGVDESDTLGTFVLGSVVGSADPTLSPQIEWRIVWTILVTAGLAFVLAWWIWVVRPELKEDKQRSARPSGEGWRALGRGMDEAYRLGIVRPARAFSRVILYDFVESKVVERWMLLGGVRMLEGFAVRVLRRAHPGRLQGQILLAVAGGVFVIGWLLR